jgi:hypothetical protein
MRSVAIWSLGVKAQGMTKPLNSTKRVDHDLRSQHAQEATIRTFARSMKITISNSMWRNHVRHEYNTNRRKGLTRCHPCSKGRRFNSHDYCLNKTYCPATVFIILRARAPLKGILRSPAHVRIRANASQSLRALTSTAQHVAESGGVPRASRESPNWSSPFQSHRHRSNRHHS